MTEDTNSGGLQAQFAKNNFGVIPYVAMDMAPGARVVAHPHGLLKKDPQIAMRARILTDKEKTLAGFNKTGRFLSKSFAGQMLTTEFVNSTDSTRELVLHSSRGGSVVWVDAETYGGDIVCQKGAFLAALDPDAHISLKKINASAMKALFFSNEEIFFERVQINEGADPHIFIGSKTMTMSQTLERGERLHVHSHELLAATAGIDISIEKIPGFWNRRAAGEGSYLTVVTGPGTIWLQTQNVPSAHAYGHALAAHSPFHLSIPALF